jgi:antitoxin component of RelBE/YafQ-DinJ toxin-antitoxin module
MNVTLAVDEQLLERARRVARASGTSLNQMIRDYLAEIAGDNDLDREVAELRALSATGSRGEWSFDRDELHERG